MQAPDRDALTSPGTAHADDVAPRHVLWRRVRRALYWALPPVLLYLVFRRIELQELRRSLAHADVRLISAGLALVAAPIATAGVRWHLLLRRYAQRSTSLSSSIGDYWRSLSVGLLVPGSLGSDAYRVMVGSQPRGQYLRAAFVVLVEKLAALVSCSLLIVCTYPLLRTALLPTPVVMLVDASHLLLLAGVLLVASAFLLRRQAWAQRLVVVVNGWSSALARRVEPEGTSELTSHVLLPYSGRGGVGLLLSVLSPTVGLPALLLSLMVQVFSAIQSQLYFQGVGHTLPFLVNLFVTPILFLLGILPISFGGIGIREGAYVLLYGAFGVPPPTALVVSLCFSLGMLIRHTVGALLFLSVRRRSRPNHESA